MPTTTYKQLLTLEITPREAKEMASRKPSDSEVFVTPTDVELVLEKYLSGEVRADLLYEWAGFVVSSDVYVTPGWQEDAVADAYEPMWEILQELSAPSVNGPLTEQRALEYLSTLATILGEAN